MSAKRRLNSLRPKAFIYCVCYTLWRGSVISGFSWQSYWWLNFTHRLDEEQWNLSNLNYSTWWKDLFCFENKYISQADWRKQGVKRLRINENLVSFWYLNCWELKVIGFWQVMVLNTQAYVSYWRWTANRTIKMHDSHQL